MKMHEINESQIDELGGVGKAIGKAAKSVAKGAADFGRGVKAGYTGKTKATSKKAASSKVSGLQQAIKGLDPRELKALQKQIAKQARTAK